MSLTCGKVESAKMKMVILSPKKGSVIRAAPCSRAPYSREKIIIPWTMELGMRYQIQK